MDNLDYYMIIIIIFSATFIYYAFKKDIPLMIILALCIIISINSYSKHEIIKQIKKSEKRIIREIRISAQRHHVKYLELKMKEIELQCPSLKR